MLAQMIVVCSVMSELARPTIAPYTATKGGLKLLTRGLCADLGPLGIQVNAIAPAAIHTPMMDTLPAERIEALRQAIPVGRVGNPAEIGAMSVYLASDSASFITGATMDINGGMYMR